MDISKEVWRDINGYEGLYQVSTTGRVRSLDRKITTLRNGTKFTSNIKGVIMTPDLQKSLHKKVGLSKNGTTKKFLIHRLVADNFLDNPENKPCVNHIDGNPKNNSVNNLEWCTYSENTIHAIKNGLLTPYYNKKTAPKKLNDLEIITIRMFRGYFTSKQLSKEFDITQSHVNSILSNRRRSI